MCDQKWIICDALNWVLRQHSSFGSARLVQAANLLIQLIQDLTMEPSNEMDWKMICRWHSRIFNKFKAHDLCQLGFTSLYANYTWYILISYLHFAIPCPMSASLMVWRCFKMCQSVSVDDPSWSDHSLTSAMAPCERRVITPRDMVLWSCSPETWRLVERTAGATIFLNGKWRFSKKIQGMNWWNPNKSGDDEAKTSGNTYGHTPENSGNPIPCWRTPETLSAIPIQHQ